jgi:hypothetical protein
MELIKEDVIGVDVVAQAWETLWKEVWYDRVSGHVYGEIRNNIRDRFLVQVKVNVCDQIRRPLEHEIN